MTHRFLVVAFCCALITQVIAGVPRGLAEPALELAVIVHPSKAAAASKVSDADLQAIFLRRKQFLSDGSKVVPLNLLKGHAARVLFDQVILGFDADASARFWIDQQVRGAARAPIEVATPELALRTLQVMPDAIAYVPAALATGANVAVVARVRDGKLVAAR
jgi:hypothetical protein